MILQRWLLPPPLANNPSVLADSPTTRLSTRSAPPTFELLAKLGARAHKTDKCLSYFDRTGGVLPRGMFPMLDGLCSPASTEFEKIALIRQLLRFGSPKLLLPWINRTLHPQGTCYY
jgi:hypothetical protein